MITCNDLTFSYGKHEALRGLSFHLPKQSTSAIIGRSGSGKTTLLHLLAGLLPLQGGQLTIGDWSMQSVRRETAIVLQGQSLLPWKTSEDNVSLAMLSCGGTSSMKTLQDIFEELDISDCRRKYPYELSGGQRQRVAIARALVQQPDLLILDEPTSSLDALTKETIQNLLLQLHQLHQFTLVTVTHDIEEAVFLGEHLLVLQEGRLTHQSHNPNFSHAQSRKDLAFYERCIHLREVLGQ